MPTTSKKKLNSKVSSQFDLEKWAKNYWTNMSKKIKPLSRNAWVFIWIILTVVGAQLALRLNSTVGVYLNALSFALLAGLALWQEKFRSLAISAAIAPVINMIALSLPQTTQFSQTMVYYDSLLVLALIYRFIFTLDHPITYTKLTAKGYATLMPLMLVMGQALGALGFVFLRHHYSYGHVSLPLVAASVVVFAIAEETFFRGLIQQRAAQVMHPLTAAILSMVIYTFFSVGHTTILAPVFALISTIVLSLTYYKKQNLILTISINAAMKLSYVGLVAGFIFR